MKRILAIVLMLVSFDAHAQMLQSHQAPTSVTGTGMTCQLLFDVHYIAPQNLVVRDATTNTILFSLLAGQSPSVTTCINAPNGDPISIAAS